MASQNNIRIEKAPASNITVSSVTFNWNEQVIQEWPHTIRYGLFQMAYDIRNRAQEFVPVVTAALQNSIRVMENGEEIWIIAGGKSSEMSFPPKNTLNTFRYVDYAAKVEEKSSRPHYMKNAQETVMAGDWMQKYFGGITK